VDLSEALEIADGRHPVVEQVLGAGRFVPNDTALDLKENRLMILTGPNMAGKSTYMRQVALIALLAQTGSFVPARSARIGIVDRIYTRVGASDDLASGQSTFMVEMTEVAGILATATRRSLLVLDEIGRGTSTYDGLSIAWAVIEYVSDSDLIGARTLFATHYHELTDLEGLVGGVVNYRVAVDERSGEVVFLHRIEKGGSDNSYGIEVARLAGVPDAVVQRSKELLATLERERGVRDRLKVRKGAARPMDGQIDLFAASMALKSADGLLDELKALEVSEMTPLDALNVLYDLQQRARRNPRNG
jgi:DNA mismatch repair protein MutS